MTEREAMECAEGHLVGVDDPAGQSASAEIARIGFLDLRSVRARVVHDDGDATLLVSDGESEVEFTPGFGPWRDAVAGLERLVAAALVYANTFPDGGSARPPSAGPTA